MAPRSHFPDTAAGLTRRQWLQGTLALAAAGLAGSQALRAIAQAPTESLDAFMALSQALTARPALDRGVGTRLLAALGKSSADFAAQLRPLAQALAAARFPMRSRRPRCRFWKRGTWAWSTAMSSRTSRR